MSQGLPTKTHWVVEHGEVLISLVAAVAAVGAVVFSIWNYNAAEGQRKLDNDRQQRMTFLSTLQSLLIGNARAGEMRVLFKDSDSLGSMQAALDSQMLMLLLQAENVLPDMEKRKEVTQAEYLVLAEESLNQGFYDNAHKYATVAASSSIPRIQADAKIIFASLKFSKGHLDEARDEMAGALKIYENATQLLVDDQMIGMAQTCVTWSDLELGYGDITHAEDVITRGEGFIAKLRPGGMKDSGKKFFEAKYTRN